MRKTALAAVAILALGACGSSAKTSNPTQGSIAPAPTTEILTPVKSPAAFASVRYQVQASSVSDQPYLPGDGGSSAQLIRAVVKETNLSLKPVQGGTPGFAERTSTTGIQCGSGDEVPLVGFCGGGLGSVGFFTHDNALVGDVTQSQVTIPPHGSVLAWAETVVPPGATPTADFCLFLDTGYNPTTGGGEEVLAIPSSAAVQGNS